MEPTTATGEKHEEQSVHRPEETEEQKVYLKEGNSQKAAQTKDTKRVEQEDEAQLRARKTSMKTTKMLVRLPQEQPHITGKELILLSTPPQKGKEVLLEGNPFSALVEVGKGGTNNIMINI